MVTLVLLVCLVVGAWAWLSAAARARRGMRARLRDFPGDAPLPFVGNALQLGVDADETALRLLAMWRRHGGSNFRVTVGGEEWVLLTEPGDVRLILSHPTEAKKPNERNSAMAPFFGLSVATAEGDEWRSMRRLMAPSFSYKTLEDRVSDVNRHSEALLATLAGQGPGPVDLYRFLKPFLFDVACRSLMGVDCNLSEDPDHPYLVQSGKLVSVVTQSYITYWCSMWPLSVLTPGYWRARASVRGVRDMSDHVIAQRRMKLREQGHAVGEGTAPGFLLDALLACQLSDGAVNDEISFLLFTGYFILATSISHALYQLAQHPDVQRRVLDEQRAVLGERAPNANDLHDMPYLDAVLRESMRLVPTVTRTGRLLQHDLTLTDGRVVPAGATVIIYYEALCCNQKVYSEPHKFIPERFLEELPAGAFMPFGGGLRTCVGMRYAWATMKATLAHVVRRFELAPGGAGAEPRFAHRLLTESTNGVQVHLKCRDQRQQPSNSACAQAQREYNAL